MKKNDYRVNVTVRPEIGELIKLHSKKKNIAVTEYMRNAIIKALLNENDLDTTLQIIKFDISFDSIIKKSSKEKEETSCASCISN